MSPAGRLTLTIDDPLAPTPQPPGAAQVAASNREATASAVDPAARLARSEASVGRLRTVAIEAVVPNPRQPRKRFDPEALQGLADSILERGIVQPPVVREVSGGFELVAGERRWRAAMAAGLRELEVLITDRQDRDGALLDAVIENVAREDLSPVEAARAYAVLIEELGITREQLGRQLGRSRVSISNHLRLLCLPDEALVLLDGGELTFAHGRALLLCDDQPTRRRLARQAAAEGWSTRQLEHAARAAGAPRARPEGRAGVVSADQRALADRLGEAVSRCTGVEVSVRAAAGARFAFTVCGVDDAHRIAGLLGAGGGDEPS